MECILAYSRFNTNAKKKLLNDVRFCVATISIVFYCSTISIGNSLFEATVKVVRIKRSVNVHCTSYGTYYILDANKILATILILFLLS